jgi:hypothetical protein
LVTAGVRVTQSAGLPALFLLEAFGGHWERYENALYGLYLDDMANAGLTFRGSPIQYQFRPLVSGKGFGFWHLITEGPDEHTRTPDMRRCERIPWIPWMIVNAEKDLGVLWWENQRGSSTHVVLWLEQEDFVVVLAKRSGYFLLKSAYVLKPYRRKSMEQEWKAYWKKQKG